MSRMYELILDILEAQADVFTMDEMAGHIERALLGATGGPDHLVNVSGAAWTVQHPLDERFEGTLFDCVVTKHVAGAMPSRLMPGDGHWRVRITETTDGVETLEWERAE